MAVFSQYGGNNGGTYAKYFTFQLTVWEKSYSVEGNYSVVGRKAELISGQYGKFSQYYGDWVVNVAGESSSGGAYYEIMSAYTSLVLLDDEIIVYHDDDGSKKISCAASLDMASGTYSPGDFYVEGTLTLTNIPRASKITAIDANIESATTININRAVSSFTHTITYSFAGLTGTIATQTNEASVGWQIPESFYEKIPNSKTGTVTLTCITYNGTTVIGTTTTTFTVTASEDKCRPDILAVLVDSNEATISLTGDNSKLIKYKSTAKITPTATGKNSAIISKIMVNNTEVSGNYIAFSNVQSDTFTVIATDSRGYTNSVILEPDLIPYIPLSATARFERVSASSSEVKVRYSGNYYNGSFGNVDNELIVSWAYKAKDASEWITGGTLTPTIENNIFSGESSLGESFDYKKAYEFILYIEDKLSNVSPQDTVKKGEPYFDYGVDEDGNNYFWINGDLYVNGEYRKNKNLLIGNYNELETPLNNSNLIYTNEDFLTAKYVVVFYTFQETELNYLNSVIIVPGNDWSMLCGVDNKVGYVLVGLEGTLKVSEVSDDNFAVLGYSIIT